MKTKQIHLVVDVPEGKYIEFVGLNNNQGASNRQAGSRWPEYATYRIIEAGEPVAWLCPDDPDKGSAFSWLSGHCTCCGKPKIPLYLHQSGDAKDAERYKALCALLDGPGSMFTQVEIDDNYCEDSIYMTKLLDKYIEASKEK